MEADPNPRLLVDRTAGKLARWLRVLGLDVEYAATCEPAIITRLARQSGRRVVTRNLVLAERLGPGALLLRSEHLARQLRQVVAQVGADKCATFSRCNACNARLVEVPKASVKGRVPAYVYVNHEVFSTCPVCGRYYWQGTHWQHMLTVVKAAMEDKGDG